MEWHCVVEIHGGKRGQHGSGYLLAADLALTARHVVDGLKETELRLLEPDRLGFPGRVGTWQSAQVEWLSPESDLALLTPRPGGEHFRKAMAATTIGLLDGRAPARRSEGDTSEPPVT